MEPANNCNISINDAKKSFQEMMRNLNGGDTEKFLLWIQDNWLEGRVMHEEPLQGDIILKDIAEKIRKQLPMEAIFPSEAIISPAAGENSDCIRTHTIHVDAFLYDDDLVDELCEEGKLSKNYCRKCGSKDTEPLIYISHSASRERLRYIFKVLLPSLEGKTVVDVGSRLGAVLYGAYFYSMASKIIGIEMNTDLCKLQRNVIQNYNLDNRIQIVENDVRNCMHIVEEADVVVLNNSFEFFMPIHEQATLWQFLKLHVKHGAILVTVPSLEISLQNLDTGILLSKWVKEMPPCSTEDLGISDWESEMTDVKLYRVV